MSGNKRMAKARWLRRAYSGRRAVSPAIATMYILLLVIALTLVYIGMQFPTIRDLEADSQYKTSLGYFKALDEDIHALVSQPVQSSRTGMLPAGSTGELGLLVDEQAWVYTYQYQPTTNIRVKINQYASGARLNEIYTLNIVDANENAQANATTGNWNNWKVDIYWPQSDTNSAIGMGISAPPESQVQLGDPVLKTDGSVHNTMNIVIYNSTGAKVAGAWIFCTDTIYKTFSNSEGSFYLREENGAISSTYPDQAHMETSPEITVGESKIVAQMIQFDGGGSVANGRFNVKMTHEDKLVETEEGIYNLQLQIYGPNDWQTMWYEHLSSRMSSDDGGYGFSHPGGAEYLFYRVPTKDNPSGAMTFTAVSNLLQVDFEEA